MKKDLHADLPAPGMAMFLLLAAILMFAACGRGPEVSTQGAHSASSTTSDALHKRESIKGDEINASDLPLEAQHILQLIKIGGPFPYAKDGTVFGNREELLPQRPRGYYHEYTVKTPAAGNRGARRIISGNNGEYYYTDNHYGSFKRIRE